MGVKNWNLIKNSKQFYVLTYRKSETAIVLSMLINFLLAICVFYNYLHRPSPDYYATFGETPPVPLVAMDTPNYSSVPLLRDIQNQESSERAIPQ